MTRHPLEGRGPRTTRRQALQLGVLAAAAGGGLLGACGRERERPAPTQQIELSRPFRPVRLPLHADVPAIAGGLAAEKGGLLKVLNYPEYLSPDVIKAFGEQHGVKVEITTFTTQDEAIAKLRNAGATFDIYFPTPDILGRVAAGKLLQPLNPTYLPNLRNAWPALRDPFYDLGSQYTVPYNSYTTGIGYRTDRVSSLPAVGYDILWNSAYRGKTYVLDDDREVLAMAMLRAGLVDLNTEDGNVLKAASESIGSLIDAVNVKVGITAYQMLGEGQASVHQCWSGDIINAQYYLPEGGSTDVLGFWYPSNLNGVVGTDTMAIPRSAQKPVLAHMFLNHLLDNGVAVENFGFTGYQPALSVVTPEKMVADELVVENLKSAIVTPDHYDKGIQLLQLSPTGEALWEDHWAKFKAGGR
jgi:spermidine/putrescine transport system substrate-binding protein